MAQLGPRVSLDFSQVKKRGFTFSHVPERSFWLSDINGDSAPDILYLDRSAHIFVNDYWPPSKTGGTGWSDTPNPHLGPSPDFDEAWRARGYDVQGKWLGNERIASLFWSSGKFIDGESPSKPGKLIFSEPQHIFLGERGDYPATFRSYQQVLALRQVRDPSETLFLALETTKGLAMMRQRFDAETKELRISKALPLGDPGLVDSKVRGGWRGVYDLNGDGVKEILFSQSAFSKLSLFSGEVGSLTHAGKLFSRDSILSTDAMGCPTTADWDGDGNLDLIIGDAAGLVSVFRGTEDPETFEPAQWLSTGPESYLRLETSSTDTFLQGPLEEPWSYAKPAVVDWNQDGNLDILLSSNAGYVLFYAGTDSPWTLKPGVPLRHEGRILPFAWRVRPAVLSDDFAPSPAFVAMTAANEIAIFRASTESDEEVASIEPLRTADGKLLRPALANGNVGRHSFQIVDVDEDGRWDILAGMVPSIVAMKFGGMSRDTFRSSTFKDAQPVVYLNEGSNDKPLFPEKPLLLHPKVGIFDGGGYHNFCVELVEHPKGQRRLIYGDEKGNIFHVPFEGLVLSPVATKLSIGRQFP